MNLTLHYQESPLGLDPEDNPVIKSFTDHIEQFFFRYRDMRKEFIHRFLEITLSLLTVLKYA